MTLAHGGPAGQVGGTAAQVGGPAAEDAPMRELIIVDGFNVLHAGVLRGRDRAGWWRPEARARLIDALAPLAGGPAEVRVVFDARGGGRERDDARPAAMTNVAEGERAGAAWDGDRRSAGASNVAESARAGEAAPVAPADDDGRSARATNVARDARSGGIHHSAGATSVAGGETRTTSPGRDAHRTKWRGAAAGRQARGVFSSWRAAAPALQAAEPQARRRPRAPVGGSSCP